MTRRQNRSYSHFFPVKFSRNEDMFTDELKNYFDWFGEEKQKWKKVTSMEEDDEAKLPTGVQSLTDLVFSWSIKDVLNKDLYKDKVLLLPNFTPSLCVSVCVHKYIHTLLVLSICVFFRDWNLDYVTGDWMVYGVLWVSFFVNYTYWLVE